MKVELLEKISILVLFIVLIILMIFTPNLNTDINVGDLIINEVLLVNNNSIKDKYGKYSDYIELYNGNSYDVNLYGYYLTDSMKDTKKWSFPDITIKKNEYLIVFASSKNTVIDGEIHTNFKLDSKGETVALFNSNGKILSKVYIKESIRDTSYGYNGKEYVYYYNPTPNNKNEGNYSKKPIYDLKNNYNLIISEYMTNNLNYLKSVDGNYYSLIEIENNGEDVNLEGFYLTDNLDKNNKYSLPNISLKKDDHLIIYASGLDKYENNEIHTNFKLTNDDNVLAIFSPNKSLIDKIEVNDLDLNISSGLLDGKWYLYSNPSFGFQNSNNYLDNINNNIIINEVSLKGIELKNLNKESISLTNYSLGDKKGNRFDLNNLSISNYLKIPSDELNFEIKSNSLIYLYYNNKIVDTFTIGNIKDNLSIGLFDNKKVYYLNDSLGIENSSNYYLGYSSKVKFSKNGGYIESGKQISLVCDGKIYYTTDSSFPTTSSLVYDNPITINNNVVIKAICVKDNYLESDLVSRTFIVDRTHDLAFVSVSSNYNNLFGNSGIISNYESNSEKKINFEFYESDGTFGIEFLGDMKISGMDSRREPQKSMSIYLRKKYGLKEVTYPFFDSSYNTYSSILLRNAGEDPKNIRIMDGVLTRTLKDEMDIDMQEYRPVVVYINSEYYGIFNLREKLNGDYVESKFNIDKDNIDLLKYTTPTKGNSNDYDNLVNYIKNHDTTKSDVYDYLKTKIDIQELINYWIVESFYGNTDLGNIRYFKDDNGKWRWMLYDLDWSYWNMNLDMAYPTKYSNVPSPTYLGSSLVIVRSLYKNSEFKDLYLKSLSKYLKTTFKPDRVLKIVNDLEKEIENEMPYHIKRWKDSNSNLNSINDWHNNINNFKNLINIRYDKVVNSLKTNFNLSDSEYNKYFGDLK